MKQPKTILYLFFCLPLFFVRCGKESVNNNEDYDPDFQIVIEYLKEDSTNYFSSGQTLLGTYLSFEVVDETCNFEVIESGEFSSFNLRFPRNECWFVGRDSAGQVRGITDFLIVIERIGFGVDSIKVRGAGESFNTADLMLYNNDTITFFDGANYQRRFVSSAIPVFFETGEFAR